MKVVCDVETEQLVAPKAVWVITCRDVSTGAITVFRNCHLDPEPFRNFSRQVTHWVGHNFIGFDRKVLQQFFQLDIPIEDITDTLVLSKLINFNIEGGHSLESWGSRLGYPKILFDDFSQWSQELEDRNIQDTLINLKLYETFLPYLKSPQWSRSILTEHKLALYTNGIKDNGIYFRYNEAVGLLKELQEVLRTLEEDLAVSFPPRPIPVSEVIPRLTKKGTLSVVNLKWLKAPDGTLDLTPFSADSVFTRIEWETFNPGSSKQRIDRLWDAGWAPFEKTKGHIAELKFGRDKEKLEKYKRYGWKTSEANLATLPADAPESAKKLARWLLISARASMLSTWIAAYDPHTHRLHPSINHIGSWTHRCSHDHPNGANAPGTFRRDGTPSPYGPQMRSLWAVPPNKYQVGTDAAGIQARVAAHYFNSPEFIKACVDGTKENKDDIHYLNWDVAGHDICKSREIIKTFYYAWLLGAGLPKIAEIFGCSLDEAKEVDRRFQERYPGYAVLKQEQMPRDQRNGYFIGFDGRAVLVPEPRLLMAGYLQNGEACIMKEAAVIWNERLTKEGIDYKWINFVHDEFQTEVDKDLELCHYIGRVQAESIVKAGENLGLRCPQDGEYKIGSNWYDTHSDPYKDEAGVVRTHYIASGTSRGPRI